MPRAAATLLVVIVCVLLLTAQQSAPPAALQNGPPKRPMIPDTFTNLKVLPSDISKQDLLAIMKGMSIGLKVRCSQCHVATDDLSEADFPSDQKPTKLAAREMLRTLFETRAKYPPAQPAK